MQGRFVVAVLVVIALATPSAAQGAAPDYGPYGSRVQAGDHDFAIQLRDFDGQARCLARQQAGTQGIADDTFYLSFRPAVCSGQETLLGDVRLTGSAGQQGSLRTRTGDTYVTVESVPPIRYLEVDGKPGFSDGDWLYIDRDRSGTLSPGDLRLSTPGLSVAGSDRFVLEGHPDLGAAEDPTKMPRGTTFAPGFFALRFHDADGNGRFDPGDTLVAVHQDHQDQFLSLGHVFLGRSGGRPHGGHVTPLTPHTIPTLLAVDTSDVHIATTSHACTTSPGATTVFAADIYLHFGGYAGTPHTHIQVGDIVLRRGGGDDHYMVRVASPADGAGAPIAAAVPLDLQAHRVFYIQDPAAPPGFTGDGWLYLDLGGLCGVGEGFTVGDLRLTAHGPYPPGSMVRADDGDRQTFGIGGSAPAPRNPGSSDPAWHLMHHDMDRSLGRPLRALADARFHDASGDGAWDPEMDPVYITRSQTVDVGAIRLHAGFMEDVNVTTTSKVAVVEEWDLDVGLELRPGPFRGTGPGLRFEPGRGEGIVHSHALWLTPGADAWVVPPVEGEDAARPGDAVTRQQAIYHGWGGPADRYYWQWSPAGSPGPLPILRLHDLLWLPDPEPVLATAPGHVPLLTPVERQRLVMHDRSSEGLAAQAYYLHSGMAPPPPLAPGTLRLVEAGAGRPAGSSVGHGDAETTATALVEVSPFEDHVRFIDDGPPGLDPGDPVYIDLPAAFQSDNVDALGPYDIRLTPLVRAGASYPAGSLVRPGDADLDHTTTWGAYGTGMQYRLYFFDVHKNGVRDGADPLYLVYVADPPGGIVVPDLLSVRLQGEAATAPPPVDSPPPTPGPRPDDPLAVVAQWNVAIHASLDVRRSGDDNVLAWTPQQGASGQQVFRGPAPWTPVAELGGSAAGFRDAGAPADATYIITAHIVAPDGTTTGFLQDPGTQDVPGLGVDPAGKRAPASVRGPGPAPWAMLALLGAAAALARRAK